MNIQPIKKLWSWLTKDEAGEIVTYYKKYYTHPPRCIVCELHMPDVKLDGFYRGKNIGFFEKYQTGDCPEFGPIKFYAICPTCRKSYDSFTICDCVHCNRFKSTYCRTERDCLPCIWKNRVKLGRLSKFEALV